MRNILVLQTQSPFNNASGREALDMLLALAAVEHKVSVLFRAAAVYQLLETKAHPHFPLKAYPKSFKLFDLYDIEQVYVCQRSLSERGIEAKQLFLDVKALNTQEIKHLLNSQDEVITS